MWIKRVLLLAPVVIIILLLQSYFWVPTYDDQVKGNPARLTQYITASIGDAAILNPILSADVPSSAINGQIFEGLLDLDENLNLRGRLATSWRIYEEACFYVNVDEILLNGEKSSPEAVKTLLDAANLSNIEAIEIIPPRIETKVITEKISVEGKEEKEIKVELEIRHPPRIKLTLKEVDQDLFEKLEKILKPGYFDNFRLHEFITVKTEDFKDRRKDYAAKLLPVTEHNPVIVFNLRREVRFHDGHPLEASDVKFTYESIMNTKNRSPRTSDYEPVKSLEIIDAYTVKVTYKRLFSPAIYAWTMGIIPEHLLNAEALDKEARSSGKDPGTFSMRDSSLNRDCPVGVGPFKFKEWKSDQYIRLVRNDDYWEGPPHYKEYVYRVVPDVLTQEMEFYAGAVDSYGAQAHQVARLREDPRFQNFSGLSYGYTYISYNMRRELFKDKRVRKALTMAINIPEIIEYVLYNQGEPTTGPFVKQSEYYDHEVKPLPYDPEGALTLLQEAGWKKNSDGWLEKDGKLFEFSLITNQGNVYREAIMVIAQNSWNKLGIKVAADRVEWSVFLEKHVDVGNFDAVVLGWLMGIEPDLYEIWHSSQCEDYQLNFVAYKNKEADDLIIKIRQEYDKEKQVKYCHQLHRIIYEDQPYTFLYVGKWTALLDKKIVIKEEKPGEEAVIKKIEATKTGDYTYHFNRWIKLEGSPVFTQDL